MKILIIRFSSFGDIVLTTPIISALKEKYKDSEIDFIVYDAFKEAITLNPKIRNTIIFDKKRSKDKKYIKELIQNLKKEKYDFVIDLHSKFLSKIIGKSISINNTKYFKYKKRKWWKTLLVKAKLINYNADCTIVESYFTALKKLNIKFNKKYSENGLGDNLEFFIDKKNENDFIKKYNLKENKYFVLAPGASKFTKKWPYYEELAQQLLKKTNDRIFVIGGKEDYDKVQINNERIINLCGKISFKESGIILKHSNIAIVNDSGPFHIARAVKTKVFVFFGPTDPKLFSFEKNTHLIYNPNCKPHSLYGDDKFIKKYENCMSDISVGEVVKKIMSISNI